jgi:RNA polymerase sigma-70 factor (ECF subfamily)
VPDERELIGRAKEYDPVAFAQIYERHYQSIYNYVYYRVGDSPLAEDLTADVFVKALESIESFTFRGVPISSWLYRIANNLIIDYFRLHPQPPALPLEEVLIAAGEGPGEVVEKDLTHQQLAQALKCLTDEQREVIILKFVERLSNPQVAEILGKTEGAIKALQHRALGKLGRALSSQGFIR